MLCPLCWSDTRVVETRAADGGAATRRRRVCVECGHRLTTYERPVAERLWVRKRSGERQRFDATKLRGSLAGAAHKRPVSGDDLDRLVERVTAEVERAGGELPAARVSELCLEGLGDLDHGAYLQYLGTLEPANGAEDDSPLFPTHGRPPVPSGLRASMRSYPRSPARGEI